MIFLVFIISGVSACVGYVAALLLGHQQLRSVRAEAAVACEDAKISVDLERKELHDFFTHVQSVAATVDGNMDRHTSRVAAFNDEVVNNVASDPKAVLMAAKRLLEANVQLQEELHSARAQIGEKQHELESYMTEARTDALTGISNRRAFDQEIHRLFAQRQRQGISFSLLILDVDHFKLFNDYHGHQTGDEMLRQVATTFDRTMREMDIVCRYGGEEFAIILPGTALKEALRAAHRAHVAVERMTYRVGNAQLNVTVSIGVAEVTQDEKVESFIERCDGALYAAKRAGRNCVCYHDGTQCYPGSVPPKAVAKSGTHATQQNLDGLAQAIDCELPTEASANESESKAPVAAGSHSPA